MVSKKLKDEFLSQVLMIFLVLLNKAVGATRSGVISPNYQRIESITSSSIYSSESPAQLYVPGPPLSAITLPIADDYQFLEFSCTFEDLPNITRAAMTVYSRTAEGELQRNFQPFFSPRRRDSFDTDIGGGNITFHLSSTQFHPIGNLDGFVGWYICEAQDDALTTVAVTDNATVDVTYLPHFSPVNSTDSLRPYYLGSTFITEGSSSDVTIEYILHEPRPPVDNVTWIFDNQIISSDDLEYVMTNRSIQIRNVNRNDSGVYQVTASNAVGEGNIGSMLIVRYPPEFESDNITLLFRVGEPVSLNCKPLQAAIYDIPFFDDGDSEGPNQIVRLEYNFTRNGTEMDPLNQSLSSWRVTASATISDTGVYSCQVSDVVYNKDIFIDIQPESLGFDFFKYSLVVSRNTNFEALTSTVNFNVLVGDVPDAPVGLVVTVTSQLSIVITWQPPKNDGGIPSSLYYDVIIMEGQAVVSRQNITSGRRAIFSDVISDREYEISVISGNIFGINPQNNISVNFSPTNAKTLFVPFVVSVSILTLMLVVTLWLFTFEMCGHFVRRKRERRYSGSGCTQGTTPTLKVNPSTDLSPSTETSSPSASTSHHNTHSNPEDTISNEAPNNLLARDLENVQRSEEERHIGQEQENNASVADLNHIYEEI